MEGAPFHTSWGGGIAERRLALLHVSPPRRRDFSDRAVVCDLHPSRGSRRAVTQRSRRLREGEPLPGHRPPFGRLRWVGRGSRRSSGMRRHRPAGEHGVAAQGRRGGQGSSRTGRMPPAAWTAWRVIDPPTTACMDNCMHIQYPKGGRPCMQRIASTTDRARSVRPCGFADSGPGCRQREVVANQAWRCTAAAAKLS